MEGAPDRHGSAAGAHSRHARSRAGSRCTGCDPGAQFLLSQQMRTASGRPCVPETCLSHSKVVPRRWLWAQGLAYLPGWAEKNFQVLAKAFEVIAQLASADGAAVSKRDAFLAIGGLVDKVADIKLKAAAGEALLALGEAVGPQFVCTQLHKKAAAHRNPKARLPCLCPAGYQCGSLDPPSIRATRTTADQSGQRVRVD